MNRANFLSTGISLLLAAPFLLGCEDSLQPAGEHGAEITLIPVSISPPTEIYQAGDYAWKAKTSGQSGPYEFTWSRRYLGERFFREVGTGSTYSQYVGPCTDHFSLQVELRSRTERGAMIVTVFNWQDHSGCPDDVIAK